jgi:hypothetical protein
MKQVEVGLAMLPSAFTYDEYGTTAGKGACPQSVPRNPGQRARTHALCRLISDVPVTCWGDFDTDEIQCQIDTNYTSAYSNRQPAVTRRDPRDPEDLVHCVIELAPAECAVTDRRIST